MSLNEFHVWGRSVRVFHWINFISFLLLIFSGSVVHYGMELGLSLDGYVLLKKIHTLVGYIFIANLLWRIVWGWTGSYYAQWRHILPFRQGYARSFLEYIRGMFGRHKPSFLGHNPLGRLAVSLFIVLFIIQGSSGLLLTGTDIYMPPFGGAISQYIAAPEVDPSEVKPNVPGFMTSLRAEMLATVNPVTYTKMLAVRNPVVTMHIWCYYLLLLLAALHIAAVVLSEINLDVNIISATFTGKKSFRDIPVDLPEEEKWRQIDTQSLNKVQTHPIKTEANK